MASDAISEELAAAMNQAMVEGDIPVTVSVTEESAFADASEVVTQLAGDFVGRLHRTEGQALVLNDGSAQRFLRFEGFRTDNGPDLVVWLSAIPATAIAGNFGGDFVFLGELKGNVGAQNYEIPAAVDLGRYSTVVIWCRRFNVPFGAADLLP